MKSVCLKTNRWVLDSDYIRRGMKESTIIRRVRVCFEYADEAFLYVRAMADDKKLLKVRYHVPGLNDEFTDGVSEFWKNAQLNLLDVKIDETGVLFPSFIVLEPDYLLDISSLSECFRDYGCHPANYFMSRLVPIDNARPLLLGNIANLFLDEWIHSGLQEPDFVNCMKKAFQKYPIELAACDELLQPDVEKEFAADCRMHFNHIRQVVQQTFTQSVYGLDKSDAVLEPSYICEALGIQGRLDYMQRDMGSFVEMKSGKADEYSSRGRILPKQNNRVQMLLYMAVLEYSMGIDRHKQHPYLLYTRYPLLYPAQASWNKDSWADDSWTEVRRVIAVRNRIVAAEYAVQMHNQPSYTSSLLAQINPVTMNERGLRGRFWEQYLSPGIARFEEKLSSLDTLEKTYFYTLYSFITKELYVSKSVFQSCEGKTGAASLWLNSLDEKRETGEILYDLRIDENQASQLHKPTITLIIPPNEDTFLPNFRKGDVVVLYTRNSEEDNVTNQMVIKGNIEWITDCSVCIRLRAAQRNLSIFPSDSFYAIEHDYMDTTFRSMYTGLSAFMEANQSRRELLLGRREPNFSNDKLLDNACFVDDFERVAMKAESAEDYFLLIGPPGTGKTSRALRRMVETFHSKKDTHILLLAYTNRAVDEICQSLQRIVPEIAYIRVGSELSCDERFREHLLENVLETCSTRREVRQRLSECRVYVGTVASLSTKTDLFKIKRFDVAIIDEATQILEPQLLWILCAKSPDGRDAVGKFIMIGDHKQLPAVVLQTKEDSEIHDEGLRAIGLYNLKDSLFERLYRRNLQKENCLAFDMLCRQGRMHPIVADFPNQTFYAGKLLPVGLPHQLEDIQAPVCFVPSCLDLSTKTGKVNGHEARMAADWAERIYRESPENFDENHTLGIITPYRSQIALIRKELMAKGISALQNISVDTVERYQGSERDVIIYSFCVNYKHQLDMLPNLTEENGVLIDRKLNVALTRARKRLVVIGVPELLEQNTIYRQLLKRIK